MSAVIIDPDDPRIVLIEQGLLVNVHHVSRCMGRTCVIHAPSDHHMRGWPINWRNDRGIFERICTHQVGHPDPDQIDFWAETDQMFQLVHGCCGTGCCRWP